MIESVEPLKSGDPSRIGRYAVLGRLGSGGMGRVYLGRSPGGLPVAIKVIHSQFARDERFLERFRREVTAARAVSGAFTAPVVDADLDAAVPWLVTAFVPGMSLDRAVTEHGPLTVPAATALGAALAEALVSIHRAGVVHRDLKPANVLLGPDGPIVIDFGIARAAEVAGITRTGSVMGTPGFMPPEQAEGEKVGAPGDVFALGAVLVYATTGIGPYGQAPGDVLLYRVVHEAPWLGGVPDPGLRDLIAECMARDPARRPEPGSLLGRLAAAPSGTAWLPAPVAAEIERRATTVPGVRRRRVLYGAAGAAVLLAGGGVATLSAFRHHPRHTAAPPADRRLLWSYRNDPPFGVHSTPIVAGGVVYVGSDQGSVYAVDARRGRLRWQQDDSAGGSDVSVLAVAGNVLLTRDSRGAVGALRTTDGKDAWGTPQPGGEKGFAVMGDRLYVAASDTISAADSVGAITLADGTQKWQRSIGDAVEADLAASGGLVYAPGRALHALNAAGGKPVWSHAMSRGSAPAVAAGVVYCGDYETGRLHALDARTGARRWIANLGSGIPTRPAMAAGTVYAADISGVLHALDPNGRVRWRFRTGGEISGGPVVTARGLILVGSADEFLYAVRADGRLAWRYHIGRQSSSPAVAGDAVYLGGSDGTVYALSLVV